MFRVNTVEMHLCSQVECEGEKADQFNGLGESTRGFPGALFIAKIRGRRQRGGSLYEGKAKDENYHDIQHPNVGVRK